MVEVRRILNVELETGQSAFLWGARKAGKSTYLKQAFPHSIVYDFLRTDVAFDFIRNPALLRERLLADRERATRSPVILDEVQKVPAILDEVHWLIENAGLNFVLCGSSARKLVKGGANLLGGRAWRFEMFPFVFPEIEQFDLLRVLNQGLLPSHYLQRRNYERSLRAYTQDYLKEEVFSEGLVRNIPAFSRFFEAMGYSHGELINYANIGRDCGVDAKTVKEYFQILVDTLLGAYVSPYKRRQSRQVISKASKFYLFDVGIAGHLGKRRLTEARGEQFGKALEHFIFMELNAHRAYRELHYEINFWRTKSGQEVDFILGGGEVAIEVKGSSRINNSDLKSMQAFYDEFRPRLGIVVSNEKHERKIGDILVLPWRNFLDRLWGGELFPGD
ncbi:MAG: AAA family ATPase [Gammaproteobacteria bacterium]|nr:AAA family ATPase [Gammaproteobacteria bacterium]